MKLHLRATGSPAIWDHTMLPATGCKWTHPGFTAARGQYLVYLHQRELRDGRLSWP